MIDDKVLGFGAGRPSVRSLSAVLAQNVIPPLPYVTLSPSLAADGSIATRELEMPVAPDVEYSATLELDPGASYHFFYCQGLNYAH